MTSKRLMRSGLALLCLVICCRVAGAAVWLSEDFDSYNNGSLTGQSDWYGTTGHVRVQTDFVVSGKAVEADYLAWGSGSSVKPVSSATAYHYIDFDVAMDEDSSDPIGTNLGFLKFYNESIVEMTRFCFAHRAFKVLLAGGAQTIILQDPGNRVWHHIRFGIDLMGSKIDVWVDGDQKVSQGTLYNSGTSISRIEIGQWNLGSAFTKSETYVDNLVAESGVLYEAATLALAPYGGWEKNHVCYPYVMYDADAGNYKMFYAGNGGPEFNESAWSQWHTGMVTSTDTTSWVRRDDKYEPVLYAKKFYEGDLIDPDESAGVFDSIFAVGACVTKEGSTYKAWYTGWGGETEHIGGGLENKINFRIGYATSTDAIDWTKYSGSAGAGAVLGLGSVGAADAKGAGHPHVIKDGSTYRMWYEGFDGSTWRILYATSSDGISWTKQGVALNPGGGGALDELGCRNPVVIDRNGTYELWYQGRSTSDPNYHVMRATSPDGLTWTKVSGEIYILTDDPVDADEQVHVDSILVQPDDSLWAFFGKEVRSGQMKTYGRVYSKQYVIYRQEMNP